VIDEASSFETASFARLLRMRGRASKSLIPQLPVDQVLERLASLKNLDM
jgi:hypothetical protein